MDVRVGLWRKLSTIDAFWTVLLEKTLESPLDCKEISPKYSLEGLMFRHLLWRTDSLEKTLMLGKIESRRRRGWQRMRSLDSIADSMDMSLSKFWELRSQVCCSPWGCKESDMTEWLNWTELKLYFKAAIPQYLRMTGSRTRGCSSLFYKMFIFAYNLHTSSCIL